MVHVGIREKTAENKGFYVLFGIIKLELSENLTIVPLQCPACSKRPEYLMILSGNVILTSIKGHNSLTNLRKLTANNPNVDLVSVNSLVKFGPFVPKILNGNENLAQIKGHNSSTNVRKMMCNNSKLVLVNKNAYIK